MKFKKFLLPMMAFIFAISMAFAAVDLKPEPVALANDYVLMNGSWEAIPEQNCNSGNETCRVQFGTDGPVYDVYDEINDPEPKPSPNPDPIILEL